MGTVEATLDDGTTKIIGTDELDVASPYSPDFVVTTTSRWSSKSVSELTEVELKEASARVRTMAQVHLDAGTQTPSTWQILRDDNALKIETRKRAGEAVTDPAGVFTTPAVPAGLTDAERIELRELSSLVDEVAMELTPAQQALKNRGLLQGSPFSKDHATISPMGRERIAELTEKARVASAAPIAPVADDIPVVKAPRVTIRNVNKALADAGHDAKVHKGKDYIYFSGKDIEGWTSTSVFVPRLTDDLGLETPATVDNWVKEFERMKASPDVNPDAAIEANRARYAPESILPVETAKPFSLSPNQRNLLYDEAASDLEKLQQRNMGMNDGIPSVKEANEFSASKQGFLGRMAMNHQETPRGAISLPDKIVAPEHMEYLRDELLPNLARKLDDQITEGKKNPTEWVPGTQKTLKKVQAERRSVQKLIDKVGLAPVARVADDIPTEGQATLEGGVVAARTEQDIIDARTTQSGFDLTATGEDAPLRQADAAARGGGDVPTKSAFDAAEGEKVTVYDSAGNPREATVAYKDDSSKRYMAVKLEGSSDWITLDDAVTSPNAVLVDGRAFYAEDLTTPAYKALLDEKAEFVRISKDAEAGGIKTEADREFFYSWIARSDAAEKAGSAADVAPITRLASEAPTTPATGRAARGAGVNLDEKLALDPAASKLFEERKLSLRSPQAQILPQIGVEGSINRYWWHRPPSHVPVPKEGGLNSYILNKSEAKAILGDVNEKGIWLGERKTRGEGSVLVDISKLDNSNMFVEQSGIVHRGDIQPLSKNPSLHPQARLLLRQYQLMKSLLTVRNM